MLHWLRLHLYLPSALSSLILADFCRCCSQLIPGDLNHGSYGYCISLCVTRSRLSSSLSGPILDVGVLNVSAHDALPPRYSLVGPPTRRNVNAGSFRDEVNIVIKRAIRDPLQVKYKPAVIDRFPRTELRGSPMPSSIALFCCPEGIELVSSALGPPPATYGSFVLTTDMSSELYCACVTFYESFQGDIPSVQEEEREDEMAAAAAAAQKSGGAPTKSSLLQGEAVAASSGSGGGGGHVMASRARSFSASSLLSDASSSSGGGGGHSLYAPRMICLLSYWPFYSSFCAYLEEVYRLSRGTSRCPLERRILNLWETPLPRSGRIRVQLDMAAPLLTNAAADAEMLSLFPPAASAAGRHSLGGSGSGAGSGGSGGGSSSGRLIMFDRPNLDEFPLANFPLTLLFRVLSLPNIVVLLSAILQEKKVILTSKVLPLLTYVAETIRALIFPMKWLNPCEKQSAHRACTHVHTQRQRSELLEEGDAY